MKKIVRILCCFFLFSHILAILNAQTSSEIAARFIDYSLQEEPLQIKARLFIPDPYDSLMNYPVVVTLHGLGECGSDNEIHILLNHLATTWGKDDFQENHPCFIFSPQCPSGVDWTNTNVYQSVMLLLDSLIGTYSIDTTRIYITGLSLGGNGTWEYMAGDPDLYAAAMPVCGGLWSDTEIGVSQKVEKFKHIPVWDFHGNMDNVVNPIQSRRIFQSFIEQGEYPVYTHNYYRREFSLDEGKISDYLYKHAELIYSEVPNWGHSVWNYAYQLEPAKEWLFRQRKHSEDHIQVEKEGTRVSVSGIHEFSYSSSVQADSITIWAGHEHSPDWELVGSVDGGTGTYAFDSRSSEDHPYAVLRFLAHDSEGYVIGKDYSDTLRIDNEGNGNPYIRFADDYFVIHDNVHRDNQSVPVLVGDPESDSLKVLYSVSYDNGQSFISFADTSAGEGLFELDVAFNKLYKSDEMVIRVEASDGENVSSDQTLYFRNLNGTTVSTGEYPGSIFEIFPNPVDKQLIIKKHKSGWHTVEITSVNGQLLFGSRFHEPVYRIDFSSFQKGTYLVTVRSRDFEETHKIIKF